MAAHVSTISSGPDLTPHSEGQGQAQGQGQGSVDYSQYLNLTPRPGESSTSTPNPNTNTNTPIRINGHNMNDYIAPISSGPGPGTSGQSGHQSGSTGKGKEREGSKDRDRDRDRDDGSDSDDDKKRRRRRGSSDGEGEGGSQRVQLACFWCRSKRVRCSGTKPVCEACRKSNVTCEWPSGRRKKRTRKEMEEARRIEAQLRPAISPSRNIYDPSMMNPQQQQQLQQSQLPQTQIHQNQNQNQNPIPLNVTFAPNSTHDYNPNLNIHENDNEINLNPFDINNMMNNELWNFASGTTSNYVWPSGFTPEGQSSTGGSTMNPNQDHMQMPQQQQQQQQQQQRQMMGQFQEPTIGQFMNTSPNTDMRLINALESGAAYIEGNPAEDEDIELFYYRFSGATAVHPGINRISLKLQKRNGSTRTAPQPESDVNPLRSTTPADLFDSSGLPHPHIYIPLFELFFKHMSQHFPSISRQRMNDRFANGTMSAFLACCICAHGARFADNPRDTPASASTPFIAQAQDLVIPLLHLPTTDVVTGLMLLTWLCYGQGSEAGMWSYSGMAFRMAIDLGLHENSEVYETQSHVVRTRLLFWNMFVMDRIIAFALGRPASIPEDIIEIPLPEDQDFFPDPARNIPGSAEEMVEPVPFVQLTKLMIICGRISNVLNGRRGRARTLVSSAEPLAEQLAELQLRLVQFVSSLPETLKWTAENFKRQQARGHGGTYLALHLWSNAVLALIYHPDLLKSPSGTETPLNATMNRNVKLALASSRQICECMVFADLVDSSSYCCTPYLTQPLFVAGMALIHELRNGQMQSANSSDTGGNNGQGSGSGSGTGSNPTDIFLLSMSRQNFQAVLNAVFKMEQYWAGVTGVSQLLEKRSGVSRPFPRQLRGTFISLPDKGLLRRFRTDPSDPQHPPTETSLRESIARSERSNSVSGPSPYWLSELMAGYTVENMSFAPADSFDLERLLASTSNQMQGGSGTPMMGDLSGGGGMMDLGGSGGMMGNMGMGGQ